MIEQIKGLHHVTSMAADATLNNEFFTNTLGLRRIKTTVNFDDPTTYHLYYGNETGTPGTVMTYFPFPNIVRGRPGVGEVGETQFGVPEGSLPYWRERLVARRVEGIADGRAFGAGTLRFQGPDGDGFVLVETPDEGRPAWSGADISDQVAIRGFSGARLRLQDTAATAELLRFMGYEAAGSDGAISRFVIPGGNGADTIDLEAMPSAPHARQGAGSVHHIAFAVDNRAEQIAVRRMLMDTGYQVTPVIDRDYFFAIYFRTPGGVLFEVATNEPGFNKDEDTAHLGEALKLPLRYEPHRAEIERHLPPLPGADGSFIR